MINKKELQNNQRVYINRLEKSLNEAVSTAGGITVKLIFVKYRYSIIKLIFTSIPWEVDTPQGKEFHVIPWNNPAFFLWKIAKVPWKACLAADRA